MKSPAPHLFLDPVRAALLGAQSALAEQGAGYLRYAPSVAPFAVLKAPPAIALPALAQALQPGEVTWILQSDAAPLPPDLIAALPALRFSAPAGVTQMLFPPNAPLPTPKSRPQIERLTCADSDDLMALAAAAYPYFFRRETCRMGPYFGIRENVADAPRYTDTPTGGPARKPRLCAMGGDRMVFAQFHEISGLCTLAEYRGRGYAEALLAHILSVHRAAGYTSFLHLASDNANALRLYQRLGFVFLRELWGTRLQRLDPAAAAQTLP